MLLTIQETAERLNVSVSLVYRLVAKGELPCYEIASCKRVSESDIQQFLDSRKKESVKIPRATGRHF